MKPWNSTLKAGTLALALLGALTLGLVPASPAAHADGGPTISAAWSASGLDVTGQGFTPDGGVLIQIDGADIPTLGGTLLYVTAASPVAIYCPPASGCVGGSSGLIAESFSLDRHCDHRVTAYDFSTKRWTDTVVVPGIVDSIYPPYPVTDC